MPFDNILCSLDIIHEHDKQMARQKKCHGNFHKNYHYTHFLSTSETTVSVTLTTFTVKCHLKPFSFYFSASVSSDLKALYKSVIIIIISTCSVMGFFYKNALYKSTVIGIYYY